MKLKMLCLLFFVSLIFAKNVYTPVLADCTPPSVQTADTI